MGLNILKFCLHGKFRIYSRHHVLNTESTELGRLMTELFCKNDSIH